MMQISLMKWVRRSKWVGVFIAALLFVLLTYAPSITRAENERVITVYHDGVEQTIVTDATTVDEALKRAQVTVNANDTVEPAASTQLVAQSYSVNVYRARPVIVVDGLQRYTVMTSHTSGREIAQAAGLTLYDEDTFTLSRIDDFLSEGGIGLKLTIDRAVPINLSLYSKVSEVRTQATTVGELLKEKNITLQASDGTNLPTSTSITAGMTLQVWRNGVQTVTQDEPIAFTTKQVRDTDKDVGYKAVQTPGENGKKSVTYQIETKDGAEVSRTIIQSVVTQAPKEQVEVIGGKAPMGNISAQKASYMAAAGIAQSDWNYVDYVITRESGWNVASKSSNGCYGLGQACPGSKLVAACPNWDADPACQLRFFSAYASRYGGWAGAYNVWIAKGWW